MRQEDLTAVAKCSEIIPPTRLSIIFHLSWWHQVKQGIPDVPLPSNTVKLLLSLFSPEHDGTKLL